MEYVQRPEYLKELIRWQIKKSDGALYERLK
jgi:hypothetical protein